MISRLLPLALAAAGAVCSAADLTGVWIGTYKGRLGDIELSFQLAQKGSSLTGKMYGDYGSTAISEAVVHDDLVTFVVVAAEQAGNQINRNRLRFTGRLLESGDLELSREREASIDAANSGVTQSRNAGRTRIVLKKLI